MGKQKLPEDLASFLQAHSLTTAERAALEKVLGGSEHFPDRLGKLRELALGESIDWLVGRRRFATVSETDTHRVLQLFLEIRNEPPTLDKLVDDLGIPEGRARSMLGRMRYGEARALRQMQYQFAAQVLDTELSKAEERDSRKQLWLDRSIGDCIGEAAYAIMQDTDERQKGKRYAFAEFPEFSSQKYGTTVWATTAMWGYVVQWLKDKSAGE